MAWSLGNGAGTKITPGVPPFAPAGPSSLRSTFKFVPDQFVERVRIYRIYIASVDWGLFFKLNGAGTKIRTRDLLITNQLLYQLSYTGTGTIRGWNSRC